MFVRRKYNRSGNRSIQVIPKVRGRYKVVKTFGCANTLHEIEALSNLAKQEILKLSLQPKLFESEFDVAFNRMLSSLSLYAGIKVNGLIEVRFIVF